MMERVRSVLTGLAMFLATGGIVFGNGGCCDGINSGVANDALGSVMRVVGAMN